MYAHINRQITGPTTCRRLAYSAFFRHSGPSRSYALSSSRPHCNSLPFRSPTRPADERTSTRTLDLTPKTRSGSISAKSVSGASSSPGSNLLRQRMRGRDKGCGNRRCDGGRGQKMGLQRSRRMARSNTSTRKTRSKDGRGDLVLEQLLVWSAD